MKLVLEMDFEKIEGEIADQVGRALRYWGGAIKHLDLDVPQRHDIYDAGYQQPIGCLEILPGDDQRDD